MTPAKKTVATPHIAPHEAVHGAEPAARVLRRFRVVFNAVKTHFRQMEKDAGLGGAQVWALSIVAGTPDIGVNDLALAMDVHQSTASNLLKSLVEREMVATAKSSTDRRVVALRATPKGQKVLRETPGPFAGVLPGALASLDVQTLARLDRDLAKLIAVLAADEQGEGIPLAQQ